MLHLLNSDFVQDRLRHDARHAVARLCRTVQPDDRRVDRERLWLTFLRRPAKPDET